jgi:hypothetical protein
MCEPMRPDRIDISVRRAILEGPSCRKCGHPMWVGRSSAGAIGYQELAFECSTCGRSETLAMPVDSLRTERVCWLYQ